MTRLLRLKQVKAIVPLGTSTIYRRMEAGTFPKPRSLGGNVVAWLESDIENWIAETHSSDDKPEDQPEAA